MTSTGARLRGFAPVIDPRVTTMVLGSFPSVASLTAGSYYAHPRNQFWALLGLLIDEPLATMRYEDRLRRALENRIGLWDVYGTCVRRGSLDAGIIDPAANDLAALRAALPRLRAVAFNGQAAGRREPELRGWGVATAVLPSTSPAHASLSFERKLECWRSFFTVNHMPEDGDRRPAPAA